MRSKKKAVHKLAESLFANKADFGINENELEERKHKWRQKKIKFHDLEYQRDCAMINETTAEIERINRELQEVNAEILQLEVRRGVH